MPILLKQFSKPASETKLAKVSHTLILLPERGISDIPFAEVLAERLKRKKDDHASLAKTPLSADVPQGGRMVWGVLKSDCTAFERHTIIRKALMLLLEEQPESVTVAVYGNDAECKIAAEAAVYVCYVNGQLLPQRKNKDERRPLNQVTLHGYACPDAFAKIIAVAQGNMLTRSLTVLPPNELTPSLYREKVKQLAKDNSWKHEEFDFKKLGKMGAGAFLAVAQGSDPQDAAIVHLSYVPKKATQTIALVGKGICFDTGGHNLKPARYMHGMHEDMNGSAVALGILLAATQAQLPIQIDCWLAIAQNHISPKAYKQNDVVTALNGTTIEIIHTDAEGRMVLADTLTLASRQKPDVMVDFATLTGSMATALGDRYSGVLSNQPKLLEQAVKAGQTAGERVNAFPFDSDYDSDLDSAIADIKQCTLEGDADHILATRFLSRFVENETPWLHVDLSSSNRKGGLGAVASDVNGFGVAFGMQLLNDFLENSHDIKPSITK